MIFDVDLPICPSSNNAYVNVKGRGRVPSAAHKAWKKLAGPIVLKAWQDQCSPIIGKPYAVHIAVNINHQGDIANREKLATDLLVATIPGFPGDQWADQVTIVRDNTIEGMRIEVVTMPEARAIGELIPGIMRGIISRMDKVA